MMNARYKFGTLRERIFWRIYTGFRAAGYPRSKALRLAEKLSGITQIN